jgi:hypothetical protein
MFGRQFIAERYLGLPGLAAVELPAFFQQLRARCAMDGTIHAAAAQKGGIGSVDNDVNGQLDDVSLDGPESCHSRLSFDSSRFQDEFILQLV